MARHRHGYVYIYAYKTCNCKGRSNGTKEEGRKEVRTGSWRRCPHSPPSSPFDSRHGEQSKGEKGHQNNDP